MLIVQQPGSLGAVHMSEQVALLGNSRTRRGSADLFSSRLGVSHDTTLKVCMQISIESGVGVSYASNRVPERRIGIFQSFAIQILIAVVSCHRLKARNRMCSDFPGGALQPKKCSQLT